MVSDEMLVAQVLWLEVMLPNLLVTFIASRFYIFGLRKIFQKSCYLGANLLSLLTLELVLAGVYYMYPQNLLVGRILGSTLTIAFAQSVWLIWDYRRLIVVLKNKDTEELSEKQRFAKDFTGVVGIFAVFVVLTMLGKWALYLPQKNFAARLEKIMDNADQLYAMNYIWGTGIVNYCRDFGVEMENYQRFHNEKIRPLYLIGQELLVREAGVDDFEKLVSPRLLNEEFLYENGRTYLEEAQKNYNQKQGSRFPDKGFCEDMEKNPEKFFGGRKTKMPFLSEE